MVYVWWGFRRPSPHFYPSLIANHSHIVRSVRYQFHLMASKSQLKKQAQAAAAAAGRMEDEVPQMPTMPDPRVKYLWSGDPGSPFIIPPTPPTIIISVFSGKRV